MAQEPSEPGQPDDGTVHTPVPLPARYRFEAALGEGGLGTVVKAYDTQLRTHVAIKMIRHDLAAEDPQHYTYLRDRFRREAIAGARPQVRDSPYVVTVYDQVVDSAGNAFLVLQFAPGGTLRDRLKDGPLPVAEALRLVADAARGLEDLHDADLVHRDVKPENIFIAARSRAQIGDLGIVQMSTTTFRTRLDYGSDRGHPGTPMYMGPEQVNGTDMLTAEADQYSLGAVLFELLTGRRYKQVYEDEREELLGRLPAGVAALIRRMTAERPADRYRGMSAVLAAIDAITLTALSPAPTPPSSVPPASVRTQLEETRRETRPQPVSTPARLAPPPSAPAPRPIHRRAVLAGLGAVVVAGGAWALTHASGDRITPATQASPTAKLPTLPYAADFTTWSLPIIAGQGRAFLDSAGEYHVRCEADGRSIYMRPPGPLLLDDFVLDIDARLVSGAGDGQYGVAFRIQSPRSGDKFAQQYKFLLFSDGAFFLDIANGDDTRTSLQAQKFSSAINKGSAPNHLRIECRGTQIILGVNGMTLGTYTGSVVAAGEIGLEVDNPHGSAATEASFKNLRVTKPA